MWTIHRYLRGASHAFRFAKKCATAIDEIVSDVEPRFRKWFHTRAYFTRSYFIPTKYESVFASTPNFSWRRLRQCWISIFIEAYDGELAFGIAVQITRDNMKKLNHFSIVKKTIVSCTLGTLSRHRWTLERWPQKSGGSEETACRFKPSILTCN